MASQVLNKAFGGQLDYPIADYVDGLFSDPDADPQDTPVDSFVRPLLECQACDADLMEEICADLQARWNKLTGTTTHRGPARMEVALDMRRQEVLSKRNTVAQVVDVASVVKVRMSLAFVLAERDGS